MFGAVTIRMREDAAIAAVSQGGDSGAGVVVVAMGGMRLEVIVDGVQRSGVAVPRQASISDRGMREM